MDAQASASEAAFQRILGSVPTLSQVQLRALWHAVYERLEQLDEQEWEALPGSKEHLKQIEKELESGDFVDLDEFLDSRKAG